jgi:hypothetical protein
MAPMQPNPLTNPRRRNFDFGIRDRCSISAHQDPVLPGEFSRSNSMLAIKTESLVARPHLGNSVLWLSRHSSFVYFDRHELAQLIRQSNTQLLHGLVGRSYLYCIAPMSTFTTEQVSNRRNLRLTVSTSTAGKFVIHLNQSQRQTSLVSGDIQTSAEETMHCIFLFVYMMSRGPAQP